MSLIVDIKKRLGSFSLSAQLEAGEGVTGILGSSGCGKSMTLKCIAGIELPDSGHIELDGEVLYDSKRHIDLHPQQRRVGYLFQNYALFPNMTLRQNILCGLRNQPDKAQRVKEADEMIALMGLNGLEKHRPYQLSGGQQQRAALGRILVNKPKLLMLDEPFSALDTYLRERLQAEMRELLKSYGGPVLLVTHSRDEAYRLCRSIAVMDKGSTTPPRPTKELFEDPHTVAAASLTGCKNISKAEKRGEHQLYAVDWGVTLTAAVQLHDGLCAVGVRAHDIHEEERHNRYAIVCGKPIEDPFELTQPFTFDSQPDKEKPLWATLQRCEDYTPPKEVGIAPDKVLPLYEK